MSRAAAVALFSFCIAGAPPGSFAQGVRFAWLTDTHVGGTTGEADLRSSVRDLNAQPELQFVLLSGDITESGTDAQLQLAKSILDSLRHPYYIIPGNHDTKWSESGGQTFSSLFGGDRFSFAVAGFRFIGMHQGPRMRMGDGYWAPEDVRWLDSLFRAHPDRNQPLLFVTHYPVDSSISNWYEILDLLKTRNTECILVGHGHRNRVDSYEGVRGVMSRSNLRRGNEAGGYTIVRSDGDSLRFAERNVARGTIAEWHAIGIRSGFVAPAPEKWPRPSFEMNTAYPDVRVEWSYSAGSTIAAGGASDNRRVYVGAADGSVTALSAESGRPIWRRWCRGAVYATPVLWEGHVIIGACDSTIRSFSAEDGREEWSVRTGGPVLGTAAVLGGIAYVGSSDRRVRALDAATGRVRWTSDPFGGFIEARPLIYRGKVIVGAWDGSLHALDSATGSSSWEWAGEKPGILLSPAACWPVGSGGKVFVVAPDRKMTAIDAASGRVIWRSGAHEVRETIGLSEDGGRVMVRLMRDTIMAFSVHDTIPAPLWATPCGFGYDINSAMLVEKEGVVFYPTKDGVLLALESHSGRILWKYRVGVGLVNSVAPLSRRRIVTTGFDGVVRMIAAGGEE